MISYAPLWETMKRKNATTYTLQVKGEISSSTVRRLKANESVSTNTLDALCNVVGGIESHHFARSNDVNFLSLAFTDWHCKTTAHHVAKHVVEYIVEVISVRAEIFQHID